jgi:multiple sugar transport system substrate-binding protein
MPLGKTRRRLIGAAAVIPLLVTTPVNGPLQSASAQAGLRPQANLNPCPKQTGKVNITFWTWEGPPSVIQHIVNEFNASHPDIHVNVDQVTPGFSGGYEEAFNALRAGKAPDVDMIEYYELPNFRFVNGLYNAAGCPAMKNVAKQFPAWVNAQDAVGEPGAVYAVPEDIEPLGMFYRKDLFAKYNLPVPTTWAQYQSDALAFKTDTNGTVKMADMNANDFRLLVGLDWQAGALPFQYTGSGFTFDMDSPQAQTVANYWEGLIKDGVIDTEAGFTTPPEYITWNNGTVATQIGPDYLTGFFKGQAPAASGDWAVAPIPQWAAGDHADGQAGGSATAIMAGTKHPYADAVFADWFAANYPVQVQLYAGYVLAGANSYLNNPAVIDTPNPYFGGQAPMSVFRTMANYVNTSFQWAPNMTAVFADLQDNLQSAFNGSSTIEQAFVTTQNQAASNLRSLGVTVYTK